MPKAQRLTCVYPPCAFELRGAARPCSLTSRHCSSNDDKRGLSIDSRDNNFMDLHRREGKLFGALATPRRQTVRPCYDLPSKCSNPRTENVLALAARASRRRVLHPVPAWQQAAAHRPVRRTGHAASEGWRTEPPCPTPPFTVDENEADATDASVFMDRHAQNDEVVWALEVPVMMWWRCPAPSRRARSVG